MIVFLHFPHFYVRALGLLNAERAVLVMRDRSVLDLNVLAEHAGAHVGMSINEAKAMIRKSPLGTKFGVQFIDFEQEKFLVSKRKWLDHCVGFSDVIEDVEMHQAYVDVSAHPDPCVLLPKLVSNLEYGCARTKWLAKSAWLQGDREDFAYHSPNFFLDSLPTALLTPVKPEMRGRLEFLGYRTAGEVAKVGLDTLRAQFGAESHIIYAAARGRGGEQVKARYPLGSISDRICFESPVDDLQILEHAVGQLSNRMGELLQRKEMQSSSIYIRLETESGNIIQRHRQCSKPIYNSRGISFYATPFLESDEPLVSVRLQLSDLAKVNRKQNSLYVSRTENEDTVKTTLQQVKKSFGSTVVRQGSEISLTRRQQLLRVWKHATGWS